MEQESIILTSYLMCLCCMLIKQEGKKSIPFCFFVVWREKRRKRDRYTAWGGEDNKNMFRGACGRSEKAFCWEEKRWQVKKKSKNENGGERMGVRDQQGVLVMCWGEEEIWSIGKGDSSLCGGEVSV